MNWRLKSAIRHFVMALPGGVRLYRWLTCQVLGTSAGMAAKWLRVFPTHLRVVQERFGGDARTVRMWCFDSGATIAPGLAMSIATDASGLLTDRENRLSDRYCQVSRRQLEEKGPQIAQVSGAPPDRVEKILALTTGREALDALRAIDMAYSQEHAAAEDPEWLGALGCVFSSGTLEHYSPEQIEEEVARMARVLPSGGVMSHVVDHRDHSWHADKRISPLQHLTLEEDEYIHRFGNPLEYHNRWLRSRYLELFERHGFRVECRDVFLYTDDLAPLERSSLAPQFRQSSSEDLTSLVTHFIVVRP